MDIALGMARKGEPEGTVVQADAQRSGRGRRGGLWWDKPGESVLLSVILDRPDQPERVPHATFVVSLGVRNCLARECGVECRLKWPNDVMISGLKVAGVLIEACESGVVAGIGVNLRQRRFPQAIQATATSVALQTGLLSGVDRLAERVAESVLGENLRYRERGFEDILAEWRKYMWGVGSPVEIRAECDVFRGTIADVDASGALVVTGPRGTRRLVHAADEVRVLADAR